MPRPHILVVEDDVHIREGLIDALASEGYEVSSAADGEAALEQYRKDRPGLILLDIMMPEKSGYDVCRQIRKTDNSTPIIMLTAKGEEIDKVVGLELGADDYVTKPFGVRELLARVAAVLRRSNKTPDRPADALPDTFQFGEAEIDRTTFRGTRGTVTFELTPREMRLLEYFFERPGVALSREKILRAVWEYDYYGTSRTLDQHIAKLRKKIEPDPSHPRTVTTVHGLGYRYDADPE